MRWGIRRRKGRHREKSGQDALRWERTRKKVSKGREKGDKGEERLNRGLSRHINCKKC